MGERICPSFTLREADEPMSPFAEYLRIGWTVGDAGAYDAE